IDQASLMAESVRLGGGFRPDLLAAMKGLRPPVIRWPGGCYAERYRWKNGIGSQARRGKFPITIWDDDDVNSLGTDEFIALCRRLGAEPLIVINAGRHDPETPRAAYVREACDWLEYCNGPADSTWGRVRAKNGHPEPYGVTLWEIDNETWPVGADEYCRIVKEFVPALKAVDPSIKIAVCGSGGFDNGRPSNGWNAVVIRECAALAGYLSIHHYEDPRRFADGPRDYEAFFHQVEALIKTSANPDLKIYVSEWNAQSTDWRTGLYCGGLLNGFERCGGFVGMAAPALFLRHVSASNWDNAFINFDQKGWFPAPNYVVMKLWHDHYAPLRVALEGDEGPLNAVATRSEDGQTVCLKAVNPSEEAVEVSVILVGNDKPRAAEMQLVAPGSPMARNTLDAPEAVRPEAAAVRLDGGRAHFMMPPLSAGVVVLKR
ncbi:MAG: alpha-L-arabinofuranosidase, partial [bacterium]|nr:alpha-L-arabinofuranosidase [bacterium]